MNNKSELRKFVRDQRNSLSQEQQLIASEGLLMQLQSLSLFQVSKSIAMYLINDGEIDPVKVMHYCWQQGKQAYVPIVLQQKISAELNGVRSAQRKLRNSLLFAPVTAKTRYEENKYGIKEPIVENKELISAEQLDLVLMPLVAFDDDGNRLGMGGGFYDTTFEFKKSDSQNPPHLIGVAHEIQKVPNISAEHWDIPLTTVVTDQRIYNLK